MVKEKRHTCIICGSKRNELFMQNVFGNSWACSTTKHSFSFLSRVCLDHPDIKLARKIKDDILNLEKINIKHLTS